MPAQYHWDLMQGSDKWLEARRGLITASEMKLVLTPTLKAANNEKTRAHVYELAAQRISGRVEPGYEGYDMLRGKMEEQRALSEYGQHVEPVKYCGFITNDKWGFTLGYSPDSAVGDAGLVEAKSRVQKYQVQTLVECVAENTIPQEFMLQCQTGLLVSEREWLDFISFSNGLPMCVIRVYPDEKVQAAIIEACEAFEAKIAETIAKYQTAAAMPRVFPTEWQEPGDMI